MSEKGDSNCQRPPGVRYCQDAIETASNCQSSIETVRLSGCYSLSKTVRTIRSLKTVAERILYRQSQTFSTP
jgi:hypothetical protein